MVGKHESTAAPTAVAAAMAGDLIRSPKFSDMAWELIRERIMTGQFAAGSRLNEVLLAEEMGISRPPVREALRGLAAQGLVELVPGRGARVATLDRDSVQQVGEVREILECAVAGLAAERADDEDRRLLQDVMRKTEAQMCDGPKPYPHHIEFHTVLADAARNPRLTQSLEEAARQMRLVSIQSNEDPGRALEVLAEHRDITQAVLDRDPDAARAAMTTHIRAITRAIVTLLDQSKGAQA